MADFLTILEFNASIWISLSIDCHIATTKSKPYLLGF